QVKGRATADGAVHRKSASHQFSEAFDDREADTGALPFRGSTGIRLDERLKDFLEFIQGNSDASVLDIDQKGAGAIVLVLLPGDSGFNATLLGELNGIAEQVHQHLA